MHIMLPAVDTVLDIARICRLFVEFFLPTGFVFFFCAFANLHCRCRCYCKQFGAIRDGSQAPSLLSQSMPKGHYDIPESQNSASGWQWVVNAIYLPIDTGVDTQIPKFRIQILHFTLNMTSPKQYRKKHASAARLHIIFAEGPQRSLVSFCVTLALASWVVPLEPSLQIY